jgi:hypothetical protein
VCLAQQPDVKPHRIFRTRRSRASPKRGPEGQNYSRFILRIFGGPSGPKSCSETLRETTSAANYRICTMILSSVMKSVHCRMQSILPPSAELCCHPVQRHAATSGDHQRVCKSHPRRRRAAPQLRFGQDDVRLVFRVEETQSGLLMETSWCLPIAARRMPPGASCSCLSRPVRSDACTRRLSAMREIWRRFYLPIK